MRSPLATNIVRVVCVALATASLACQKTPDPTATPTPAPHIKFGDAVRAGPATEGTLQGLTQPTTTTTVTKSDSTDTTSFCGKGIWVGGAGNVEVIYCSDSYDAATAPVLNNIPSGTFVPGCFSRVMSTGTTATNIVCFN